VIALLLLVGAGLLVLPETAATPLGRLPAAEATRLAGLSIGCGAMLIEMGLVLTAAPTVLRSARIAGFAVVCEHALGPLVAHTPVIGWATALLSAALAARFVTALVVAHRAAVRARVEPWLGWHEDRESYELVVLPTSRILAMSVPGAPPQVVVSEGVMSTLVPEECEGVVRHEMAHLRLGHRRYLLLMAGVERAFGWIPRVGASTAVVRQRLEEWADDHAAGTCERSRLDISRAITGLACASVVRRRVQAERSGALARVRRLRRRFQPHPGAARIMAYAPLLLLTLVALSLVAGWFAESRHAFALGAYCAD